MIDTDAHIYTIHNTDTQYDERHELTRFKCFRFFMSITSNSISEVHTSESREVRVTVLEAGHVITQAISGVVAAGG